MHSERPYFPAFDWLRAVLAITVMLFHDGILPWGDAGDFAVQVFFALSGWLIGGLLLQARREDLAHFYFNRAVRIWVPYYVALLLLVAASLLRDPVTGKWLEFVAYKALMVYNLFGTQQLATFSEAMPLRATGNHFWSVNAEEQFYLVAPLLLVLASRWGRGLVLWIGIALVAWIVHIYAAIVFGVVAAIAVERFGPWHATSAGRTALVVVGVASAIAMDAAFSFAAPFCAVCVVLLLAVPGRRGAVGALAGGMSYPLYLNHWIGVFVANAMLGPFGLKLSPQRHVLSFVLNIVIAVALYWWIDRRLLTRRAAWFTERKGLALALAAYAMVASGVVLGLVLTRGFAR